MKRLLLSRAIVRCHAPRRARRGTRRGNSLVEVAVAISLVSVALVLIGVLLHTVFRADQSMRGRIAARRSLGRLTMQFREDAHAAMSADTSAGNDAAGANQAKADAAMIFTLSDGQKVEYRAADGHIAREVRRGKQSLHGETYAIGAGASVRWLVAADESPAMATMLIHHAANPASKVDSGGHTERVEAVIGSNQRFVAHNNP